MARCHFVAMSGTPTKRSLRDYSHLLPLALGPGNSPVPTGTEIDDWADALDERPHQDFPIVLPGALTLLRGPQEQGLDPLTGARCAFRRRLVETPGVVATEEAPLAVGLTISPLRVRLAKETREVFATLVKKGDGGWELPDGQTFTDGMRVWQVARQVALGFYYQWSPPAPPVWKAARKAWHKACREILSRNRRNLDSESQVAEAVAVGQYPQAEQALYQWLKVEKSFEPNTVPVWLERGPLEAAAKWAAKGPGIIWTEHRAFAAALAHLTGLPYYGRNGQDAAGRAIPEFGLNPACGHGTVIASLANRTGRNLQGWSRNLVTCPPPSNEWWEQLLGRTHRDGQVGDVTFDVLVTCREYVEAFAQACRDAMYVEQTTGQIQKLSYADYMMPVPDEVSL